MLTFLGEVSHVLGVLIFCGGMMTGVLIGLYWVAPWFAVWWSASKLTATDYHMPETLSRWMATAACDLNKRHWGGTSVTPNPCRWEVPLGIYDDSRA